MIQELFFYKLQCFRDLLSKPYTVQLSITQTKILVHGEAIINEDFLLIGTSIFLRIAALSNHQNFLPSR